MINREGNEALFDGMGGPVRRMLSDAPTPAPTSTPTPDTASSIKKNDEHIEAIVRTIDAMQADCPHGAERADLCGKCFVDFMRSEVARGGESRKLALQSLMEMMRKALTNKGK